MRKRAPTAVLIVLNLALAIAVVLAVYHPARPFDETWMPYGAQVGPALTALKTAIPPASQDTHYLLVFLNSESATRFSPRVAYLSALNERLAGPTLRVVIVSTDRSSALRKAAPGVPIYMDTTLTVHKALHVSPSHEHGGVAIVDPKGAVEFREINVLASDPLRQLAEKYALGSINYRPVDTRVNDVYGVGHTIPNSLAVVSLTRTAAATPAFRQGDQVVLFIGDCAPCQLKEYLAEIAALRKQFATSNQEDKLEAVFDSSFDESLLKVHLDAGRLPLRSYKANLRSAVATAYDTRAAELSVPWTMVMGQNGSIASAYPLRTY